MARLRRGSAPVSSRGLTDRGRDEQQLADRILPEIEARHAARIGADRYAEFRKLLLPIAARCSGHGLGEQPQCQ